MRRRSTREPSPQPRLRRATRRTLTAAFDRSYAELIAARADSEYPGIAERIPSTRAGARDLLRTSAYTIALRRALVAHGCETDEADALISDIVFTSIQPARDAVFRLAGLWRRDPLARARWGARLSRRLYYTPPDWVMSDVDVDEGFGFDVTRCVIADFYEELGMSELCQRAICDQDVRSAAAHGVVLDRSRTLSAGADRCDFRYRSPTATSQRGVDRNGSSDVLEDTVEIEAQPEHVWSWLTKMFDDYGDWHPDHVSAEWIRGTPNEVGSRLRVVENLAGRREALMFELTAAEPPWRMEYRIVGPHSIVVPGGAFEISRRGDGSAFRATVRHRLGRLGRAVFGRRIDALQTHMREEGENLKRLVEAAEERERPGS